MKMLYMIGLLSTVIGLAVAYHASPYDIDCHDDGSFTISTDNPDYFDYFINMNYPGCSSQPLEDTDNLKEKAVTITCYTFELDTDFYFSITKEMNGMEMMMGYWSGVCLSFPFAYETATAGFTPDAYDYAYDYLEPQIVITLSNSVMTVGEELTVEVNLVTNDFYTTMSTIFILMRTQNWDVIPLFIGGCPNEDLVSDVTRDSVSTTITFMAVIPVSSGQFIGAGPTIMTILAVALVCTDDYADECVFYNTELPLDCPEYFDFGSESEGFPDFYDYFGIFGGFPFIRKRREAAEGKNITAETQVAVFANSASRQQYMDLLNPDLDISAANASRLASPGDLCVNKTTSIAVLVILGAGMVLSLLATVFMFIKMKKSRKLQEPDKFEHAYSNKSFSNKSFSNRPYSNKSNSLESFKR